MYFHHFAAVCWKKTTFIMWKWHQLQSENSCVTNLW